MDVHGQDRKVISGGRRASIVLAVGLLWLVGLGASCGSGGGSTASGDETRAEESVQIGCPNGPFFDASALDEAPPSIVDSSVPEAEEAIAPFLSADEGSFWPQDGWRVLDVVEGDRVLLVNLGSGEETGLSFMTLEWADGSWQWAGSSSGVECPLMLAPEPAKGNPVDWRIDSSAGPVDANTTVLNLEATERECASGQPMGDRLNEPDVTFVDDAVLIGLTVEPLDGDQNCPSNPPQKVEITLSEPVGDREIRDVRDTGLGELSDVLLALD